MVYDTRDYWVLGFSSSSDILKNVSFGLYPSSGTLKCCLEHRTMDKVQNLSNPVLLNYLST
jgi:hypothetical protein